MERRDLLGRQRGIYHREDGTLQRAIEVVRERVETDSSELT